MSPIDAVVSEKAEISRQRFAAPQDKLQVVVIGTGVSGTNTSHLQQ